MFEEFCLKLLSPASYYAVAPIGTADMTQKYMVVKKLDVGSLVWSPSDWVPKQGGSTFPAAGSVAGHAWLEF
jgi:hypothetical protein